MANLNKINVNADNFEVIFDKIDSNMEALSKKVDNVGYEIHHETFVATKGQTEFLLENEYTTKAKVLTVHVDNLLQRNGEGFKETSSKSFKVAEPLEEGQVVTAEYYKVKTKPGVVYSVHGYTLDGLHVGPEEPENKNTVWVNNADENVEVLLQSGLLQEIRTAMAEFGSKVDNVNYAITKELDPGYFKGVLPGSNPDIVGALPEGAPDFEDGAKGTVGRVLIKRGLKEDLEDLQRGELGFCIDTEELYIGNGGGLRLLAKVGGVGGGGGSNNVTGEYVELISPNQDKFRVSVTDSGKLQVFNSEVDTITDPKPDESGRFNGLLINKVYGGGKSDRNTTPVSHSFVEIYNSTETPMNLKGLSLQHAGYLEPWNVLPLRGEIKPYSSFLIRCKEHSNPYRVTTRVKITDFDMSWDTALSDRGIKVYLRIGTEQCPFTNPADTDGMGTKEMGYINMFCAGGREHTQTIDAFETSYLHLNSKDIVLKRRFSSSLLYSFANSNNHSEDIEALDIWKADLSIYAPRPASFGQWTYYYNQIPHDPMVPNMINVGFGEDGDTTRTFTWQSTVSEKGFLKYRKKDETEWTIVPSSKKFASHLDIDVTIHSVIVHGLTPGTYVYVAGEEGYWSDENELEVADVSSNARTYSILHTTDQQGWDREEYLAWEKANKYIEENETYDFMINTGDISQNANRSYEWRYYYDFAKTNTRSKVHMTCVGNNDLIDKKDSEAFTYYSTCENSPMPSVYSVNYGYIHLIGLNSNIIEGYANIEDQIAWLREDMAKPENKKRWTIVIMHESPYTIVKAKRVSPFIDVFYELGIDLVLCGHHHCYSRSKKMGAHGPGGTDTVDVPDGVYYVMSPATGFKTSGKQRIDPNNSNWVAKHTREGVPCYMMWDISYNKISMRPYRLMNILPLIDNVGIEPEAILFDEVFEIVKE